MNIKELKELINNLPGNMEVVTYLSQCDREMEINIDKEDNTIFIS